MKGKTIEIEIDDMDELKPCPLCGCRRQNIVVDPTHASYIACQECSMRVQREGDCGRTSSRDIILDLTDDWNRRRTVRDGIPVWRVIADMDGNILTPYILTPDGTRFFAGWNDIRSALAELTAVMKYAPKEES